MAVKAAVLSIELVELALLIDAILLAFSIIACASLATFGTVVVSN